MSAQLSVVPHRSRLEMICAGNKEDAGEMITAIHYYQEHRVQIQQTMTAFPSLDGARVPTLTDVEALGFSIFGHGSVTRPEVGEMALQTLRAQCSEVPHHVRVSSYSTTVSILLFPGYASYCTGR